MAVPESYQCPFCGGEATVGAPCPGCVRKRRRQPPPAGPKSWEQDEVYDGLDLPDEDFDYDDFVAKEFGQIPHRQLGMKWWWLMGVVMLGLMLLYFLANLLGKI